MSRWCKISDGLTKINVVCACDDPAWLRLSHLIPLLSMLPTLEAVPAIFTENIISIFRMKKRILPTQFYYSHTTVCIFLCRGNYVYHISV